MVIIRFGVIFYLINAIHGLAEWLQYSLESSPLIYEVPQKLSSQELKTDNNKVSAEVFTNTNYFTKLTPLENAIRQTQTNPTITGTTFDYSHSVLTTAINVFRKKLVTADLNITQLNDITDIKKTISKPMNVKNTHRVSKLFKDSEDFTRSESNSQEISADENQYKERTPGRRIFNGHKTRIKHFPFLVTVHVLGRFICGGTIIKSDMVITAAICLKRWQEWLRRNITTPETTTTTDETTTDTITTDIVTTDVIATDAVTTDVISNDVISTDAITSVTDTETTATYNTETGGTETTATGTETNAIGTETDTTTTKKAGHHKGSKSSEDSGRSSSYETTAVQTILTDETPEPKPILSVLSVRIGTNYYRLGGKVVSVIDVYFHPSYNEETLHDNLVILRLERHLNFKRRTHRTRVRKVDINVLPIVLPEHTEVTIAGWGAKTYHNKVYNALWNVIHKAVMTVSPWDQCADTYPNMSVTEMNFCALNEEHGGACNRDTGNPAVVGGLLVGIVSFGPPECGAWDSPTVFTNIGYYTSWLEEVMGEELISLSKIEKDLEILIPTTNTAEEVTTDMDYLKYDFRQITRTQDKMSHLFPQRRAYDSVEGRRFTHIPNTQEKKHNEKESITTNTVVTIENNFLLTPNPPRIGDDSFNHRVV